MQRDQLSEHAVCMRRRRAPRKPRRSRMRHAAAVGSGCGEGHHPLRSRFTMPQRKSMLRSHRTMLRSGYRERRLRASSSRHTVSLHGRFRLLGSGILRRCDMLGSGWLQRDRRKLQRRTLSRVRLQREKLHERELRRYQWRAGTALGLLYGRERAVSGRKETPRPGDRSSHGVGMQAPPKAYISKIRASSPAEKRLAALYL